MPFLPSHNCFKKFDYDLKAFERFLQDAYFCLQLKEPPHVSSMKTGTLTFCFSVDLKIFEEEQIKCIRWS